MAEFVCKLGTASGQTVTHTEDAPSEQEARQRLGAQGYYVFSIKPRKRLARLHLQALKPRSLPADDFMIFNQQFLTLSKSGLPLQKSLELLARQSRSPVVRTSLDTVRDRVRAGDLLSDAFDSVGVFPKIFCASLRAGERSGSLDKVLAQYLTYQKATRTFRKKFISALIYPAFLMCFLIGLVSFVVTFIVPRFAQLYTELDVALPTPTMLIISFSMAARKLAGSRSGGDRGWDCGAAAALELAPDPSGLGLFEVSFAGCRQAVAEVFRGRVCAHAGHASAGRHPHRHRA